MKSWLCLFQGIRKHFCRLLSSSYIVGAAEYPWDPAEKLSLHTASRGTAHRWLFVVFLWVHHTERGQSDYPSHGI